MKKLGWLYHMLLLSEKAGMLEAHSLILVQQCFTVLYAICDLTHLQLVLPANHAFQKGIFCSPEWSSPV